MDNLEKYVRENRQALDNREPSAEVWKRIERSFEKKIIRPAFKWVGAAAAVIVLGGLFMLYRNAGRSNQISTRGLLRESALNMKNPELRESEIYYSNRISVLFNQASPYLTSHPDLRRELERDLGNLDSIFYEIREDLRDNASNSDVIEALINNYRIRIMILEEMLAVLQNEENPNLNVTEDAKETI